jgi:hypothetical protein
MTGEDANVPVYYVRVLKKIEKSFDMHSRMRIVGAGIAQWFSTGLWA